MSLRLIKAASQSESSDELHLVRLLFLLGEADKRVSKTIEGITKLAKLDFLLRYPNCLERMLVALNKNVNQAEVKPYERTSIESKMIRFRYGPWDDRYRRWIGLLVSKGLAVTFIKGRTINIGLTDAGRQFLDTIGQVEEFSDLKRRSNIIYKTVGSKTAMRIKDLIYEVFPEIISLKWGQGIEL